MQTHKHANTQTNKHTNMQTNKHTNTQKRRLVVNDPKLQRGLVSDVFVARIAVMVVRGASVHARVGQFQAGPDLRGGFNGRGVRTRPRLRTGAEPLRGCAVWSPNKQKAPKKYPTRDLNPGPPAQKAGALPTELVGCRPCRTSAPYKRTRVEAIEFLRYGPDVPPGKKMNLGRVPWSPQSRHRP
jgi:hypothetical protein